MRLIRSHGTEVEDPSDEQVGQALEDIEDSRGSFVILPRSEGEFMQTTGSQSEGLMVEYRDGQTLYRCTSEALTLGEARELFNEYLRGGQRRREEYQWKEEKVPSGGLGCFGTVAAAAMVSALVAAVVLGML